MTTQSKIIVGNWKLNGSFGLLKEMLTKLQPASELIGSTVECVICAPHVYLSQVSEFKQQYQGITNIKFGAQDLSQHKQGSYTGEVSGEMLREFACDYVIVGHAERRKYHSETNQIVADKFIRAQQSGLIPIVCVGESLQHKQSNKSKEFVSEQLQAIFTVASKNQLNLNQLIIAYEPIWAIGTGKAAELDEIDAMHGFILQQVKAWNATMFDKTKVLYGGSMNANNAKDIFSLKNVAGGLVGKASLDVDSFIKIVKSANVSL